MSYTQFPGRRSAGEFAPAPRSHDRFVVLTPVLGLPSKVDTFGFGGGNPFGLPLMVELPLRLRYIAQKLEHDISNQHPGEVPALAGIQQGHIQYYNGNLFFFGQ